MDVLCLDGGSSSLKFARFRRDGEAAPRRLVADSRAARSTTLAELWQHDGRPPDAVAHRIVFGGERYVAPVIADDAVLADLERLVEIDPLHLRDELDLVYAARTCGRSVPNVLCFDTAFHQRMPDIAKRLPLPPDVDPSLRRYGFHGLSYEYVVETLGAALQGRAIVAHLGSGASLCAMRDGAPVDTTMGYSALGGLMMGTRAGDLDPGVVLRLMRLGYDDAASLADFLYRRCGLAGVSGTDGDEKALEAAAQDDRRAREALDLFCYQLLKSAGAMIAALGGLDALVFTGGIGEHSATIRSCLCRALRYAGVVLDETANSRNRDVISSSQSAVRIRVVSTDENAVMARHAYALLTNGEPAAAR